MSRFPHHRFVLRILDLEERTAPALFTVNTIADSGTGSLRQAILDASGAPGPDAWDTRLEPLPAGHALGPATVLVAKIDDEQVEAQLRKLHGTPPPR